MVSHDEVGVFRKTAEFPSYAVEPRRLRTFQDWPKAMKQKPEQLADAGFFYTGMTDRVICFSCGGGLSSWEDSDDPWEQHALYYGDRCNYLQLMKGASYHDDVITKLAAIRIQNEKEREKEEAKVKDESMKTTTSKLGNDSSTSEDSKSCKICFANESNSVFIPCGHIIACLKCALAMNVCPACQSPFKEIFRVYIV